jgi:hypothetical protein
LCIATMAGTIQLKGNSRERENEYAVIKINM